jgi:phosphomannomutase
MSDPWKACDIRGIYPDEISEDLFWRLGGSVGSSLPAASRVLIAGDFRISTPSLKAALADGLVESGAHVVDSGQVPTPVAYFAHQHEKTSAVLIVTASHNPPEYNGLKLMTGHLPPTPEELSRLRKSIEAGFRRKGNGKLEDINPVTAYKDWVLKRWGHVVRPSNKAIVLDAGSGAWSELGPSLFAALGFRVYRLFCAIDGAFPNRSPDCARLGNLTALRNQVAQTGALLGIAWDGDGDRVAFVDDAGSIVTTDEVSALMIRDLVPRELSAKVIYDIKLSDVVPQAIIDRGGRPIMQRSGHAFIKRSMIEERALFGCEASGHYFFRELNGGDDGLFAALYMTDLVHQHGRPLTDLRRTLAPFFITPDLRIPLGHLTFAEIVERLWSRLPLARVTTIDGVRWETERGHILARSSVTEPVVTLRLEGRTSDSLKELIELCIRALPEAAGQISRQIDQ